MNTQPDNTRTATAIRAVVSGIVTAAGGQPANWRETRAAVIVACGPELAALQAKLRAFFETQTNEVQS